MVILLCLACLTATNDPFHFQDVSEVDGRSVLVFRPVEFAEMPLRPVGDQDRFGPSARNGLLPVGTSPETALTIIWEKDAAGVAVLWLDADGDGKLSAEEKHLFPGKELSLPLTLTVTKGEGEDTARRTAIFRRSSLGPGLTYAIRGCVRGKLLFGKESFATMVTDANGDGCFHGAGVDRVWIDLDRNGRFDPLAEQFILGRPLTIAGVAYIVSADPLGNVVRARERGTQTGRLRLELPAKVRGQVRRFHADLVNELGEMVSITTAGQAVEVPSGRYSLSALTLELADDKDRHWHYFFRGYGDATTQLPANGDVQIPVLTNLTMKVYHDAKPEGVPAGADITVRPFLLEPNLQYAAHCHVVDGFLERPCKAQVRVLQGGTKVVGTFTSGFG